MPALSLAKLLRTLTLLCRALTFLIGSGYEPYARAVGARELVAMALGGFQSGYSPRAAFI